MDMIEKVYADNPALPLIDSEVINPIPEGSFASLSDFVAVGINLVAGIGFGFSLLSVSLGVVELVISQGDKYKIQKGQKRILYGFYGMLIAFLVVAARTVLPQLLTGEEFSITGVTP